MQTLVVRTPACASHAYEIVIGDHLFPQIASWVKSQYPAYAVAIITDSTTQRLYARKLRTALAQQGIRHGIFSIPAGERSKTISACMQIISSMSKKRYARDTLVLALGGGVVGDMAGFIAAIYNRGIPFIPIPTTLVAQADASIGGKTGIDTAYGKNLVGAFHHPVSVYIDIATLKTLPDAEFRNGLAETIKHAIIFNAAFFNFLSRHREDILQREKAELLHITRTNCLIKSRVVQQDFKERGMRKILNYGHTIGHAIETLSGYRLPHGSCVSIGMMVEGRIAHAMGLLSKNDLDAQLRILEAYGLRTKIPRAMKEASIIALTHRDKKAKGGLARYSLPASIGHMHAFKGAYATAVPERVVLNSIKETRS